MVAHHIRKYGLPIESIRPARSGVPTIAVVPPGIVHAYKNIDSKEGLVINLPDRLYMGQGKKEKIDEVRYEDDHDSPYRIED